jgi:hypothetical protein
MITELRQMVNDVNEQLIIRYFNDIVSNKEIILVE